MGRGLGRGFDSLIPTDLIGEEFDPTREEEKKAGALEEIAIIEIDRDPEQPRRKFDEEKLKELAASIREHGVLQPIVVTKAKGKKGAKYTIVAGERRWRAAEIAGLEKIPAIVRTLSAQNRLELSIIENAQREDLNAIEVATAYAKLKSQFNLKNKEIAERVGKSETSVATTMRLLTLPEVAKKAMLEHNIYEGVMRPLLGQEPELIEKAIPRLVAEDWTARQTEQYVANTKKKSSARAVKSDGQRKNETKLQEKYGVKVRVGSRSVTFACKNEEELKKLLGML